MTYREKTILFGYFIDNKMNGFGQIVEIGGGIVLRGNWVNDLMEG